MFKKAQLERPSKRSRNEVNSSYKSLPAKQPKISPDRALHTVLSTLDKKFLVRHPQELLDFWNFAKELNPDNPSKAFYDVNQLELVGAFDYLDGKFEKTRITNRQLLAHYRFPTDLPEFQTLMVYDGGRFGYWRDDPEETQPLLVCIQNPSDNFPKLEVVGTSNLFCAIYTMLKKNKEELDKYSKFFDSFQLEAEISTAQKNRKKKAVGKQTMHNVGIWVPIKNDVGYRTVTPDSLASFKKDLITMGTTKEESVKAKLKSKLMETFAYVQMGNDEQDFGMGLEFGHDLFISGYEVFDKMAKNILTTAYKLLKRDNFVTILEAQYEVGRRRENYSVI